MRRLTLIFTMLLGLAVNSFSAVELFDFQAFAVIDHCQLEWATGQEDALANFIIERSADNMNFVAVGQANAKGSYNRYQFTDSSPLAVDFDRTFYYRLKMVDRDGTFRFSEVREVALSFSAVQQTWGSIKAMFR